MDSVISIFGAIKEEISGIRGQMNVEEKGRLGRTDFWSGSLEGRRVVLVRTGIGKQRAGEAVAQILDRFAPAVILSTGYAGGLDPALKVGDLLVADRILELPQGDPLKGANPSPTQEFFPDKLLTRQALELASPRNVSIHCGGLLTVDEVVSDPQMKRQLGVLYPVRAVDMETSAFAHMAQERNVPFLSVRSISDSVDQELFDVSPFLQDDGQVSNLKAGWYVLTHPGSIKTLNHMRIHARRATDSLTRFVSSFLKADSASCEKT